MYKFVKMDQNKKKKKISKNVIIKRRKNDASK